MLKSAMRRYCFTRETLFVDLEDEFELETGSVLTAKNEPGLGR